MEFRSEILEHCVEEPSRQGALDTMVTVAEAAVEFSSGHYDEPTFFTRIEHAEAPEWVFLVLTNVEIGDGEAGNLVFQHLASDAGVIDDPNEEEEG